MNDPENTGNTERRGQTGKRDRGDDAAPPNVEVEAPSRRRFESANALAQNVRRDGPSRTQLLSKLLEAVVYELKRRHLRSPPVPVFAGRD